MVSAAKDKTLKRRIERLDNENQALRNTVGDLKKGHQSLQKALKDSRRLLNNIPGAVILIREGKILFLNETSPARLGYSQEEMLGRNFLDFIHPSYRKEIANQYKKRLAGKPVPDHYETYLVTKSGEACCCDVRVNKIIYRGRRAFLLNVVGLDEKKQEEKELVKSRKMEAMACMASGFNRGLNICLRLLDEQARYFQAVESIGDKRLARMVGKVEAAKEIARHITEQLNCLSKTENESSDMGLVDLKKIVRNAVSITRPKWEEDSNCPKAKINLKTYLRSVSPVKAHPRELQDAVVSIILNAVEALPKGGEIYLTTEEVPGSAHLYVQDNGLGIPDEIRDRIFDPFFTTHGSARNGLGLSLAYAIIKRHAGEIEVTSREGEGSTFALKLPLAREVKMPGRVSKKNRIRDSQILIIADEGMVRDLLSQLFLSKGGMVRAAFNGPEALKLLRKNSFDLVVIDLQTPDLQSGRIVPKINRIRQGLPIVLLNAPTELRSQQALEKMGADLVIGTPLDMDRIPQLISHLLATRESSK